MRTTMDSLLPRLRDCYTTIPHDVMRAAGLRDFTPRVILDYRPPDAMDVSMRISEVTVNSGDLLLHDTDGVICRPHPRRARHAEDVGPEIFDAGHDVANNAPSMSEGLGHHEFILTYKAFEPLSPSCLPLQPLRPLAHAA